MPARGDCPYISEALESIVHSTLLPIETIIVNDGMSHSAIEQSIKFRDRITIRIIDNEGVGLVNALNTGLRMSEGVFIARLDTDDLVTPERFELQSNYLSNNPEVVVVGSQCNYINSNGVILGRSIYPSGILNDMPDFREKCLIAHPSAMFRKYSAISVGGYRSIFIFNHTVIAEDFDFWLRLSRIGLIVNLENCLIYYRQHSEQLSSRNFDAQLLGTPYIAAVNLAQIPHPTVIEFFDSTSPNRVALVQTIGRSLGLKKRVAALLLVWKIERRYLRQSLVLNKVITRIITFLIVS